MSFIKYIIRRLIISIITIIIVVIVTFFISRAFPGDPVWLRLPPSATLEDYFRERARIGLDKPIIIQLFIYMKDLFTGNWGYSLTIIRGTPVWYLIGFYVPRSLEVMFISMFIAIGLGIFIGKIAAKKENSFKDYFIRIFMYIMLSVPGFVVIIFFMLLYVNTPFKIFPLYGFKTLYYPDPTFITGFRILDCLLTHDWILLVDYLWHLIVPVSAMTLVQMVAIIRQTRSSMLEVLQMDFIRTAKAKGCSDRRIINKHALKNALPPIITLSTMGFPLVMGGMVAVEVAYNFVGIGFMFRKAVLASDYPVFIAIIVLFSLIVIIFNFMTDVINGLLDPRICLC